MEVVLGKTAGFCGGVTSAVNYVEKELEKEGTVCILGELIHNEQIMRHLQQKGLKVIHNLDDIDSRK